MAEETTTVELKISTWRELNQRKDPGDSFDDVVQRLLDDGAEDDEERHEPTAKVEHEPAPTRKEPTDDLREQARAILDDLDVKGRAPETRATRREATMFAWDYIREHGRVETREVAEATYDAYRGDPDLGYKPRPDPYDGYGMWDSCVRDLVKQLPGVQGPGERGNEWRWVGED